jgi:hypothetical protein
MKGTKNVGFRAAIPLVIVYAFGVTVADKFATATVAFFSEWSPSALTFIADQAQPIVDLAKLAFNDDD